MMEYATLSMSLLAIVVAIVMFLLNLKMNRSPYLTTKSLLVELLRESNKRNESLTHLIVSRDFQTYAGLQSLSQPHPQVQSQFQMPTPTISNSDYIPRDDITEALRLQSFGTPGYGETIFEDEPDDNELAQTISEMIAGGQVEMGEEV